MRQSLFDILKFMGKEGVEKGLKKAIEFIQAKFSKVKLDASRLTGIGKKSKAMFLSF